MPVLTYRSKPTEVDAIQYTDKNLQKLLSWADAQVIHPDDRGDDPDCDLEVWDKLHNTWVKVGRRRGPYDVLP